MSIFPNSLVARRRIAIAAVLAASTMGALAGLAACLDMSANNYVVPVEEAAPPPPVVDAGEDAPDVDMRPPCVQCLETPDQPGPGCATELGECRGDPKCNATYDCVIAKSCLTKGDQKKIILCGLPCAQEAGILTQDEPSAVLILDIVACIQASCASPCKIGDAAAE
jgi:hypothetical protein